MTPARRTVLDAVGAGARGLRHAGALALALLCSLPHVTAHAGPELPDLVERIKPALVVVGTYQRTRSPAFQPLGTGFAVADGSLIVTNAHVRLRTLQSEAFEVMAVVQPGSGNAAREVQRVAVDEQHDLALLRLRTGPPLPALPFAVATVREGQAAALIGFPLSGVLGFVPAVQLGAVSAIVPVSIAAPNANRLEAGVIRQIAAGPWALYVLDAIARPGNSGSPVFDTRSGEVIAVVSSGLVRVAREPGLAEPLGITYAIPVEHVQRLLQGLR